MLNSPPEKTFWNSRFGQNGFTLVEILVVAVIMGILSAVAIPVYTGYINSQRQEVVKTIAGTAAAAANIFYRRTGALPICNEATTPNCKTLLNLFLTDPGNFSVTIQTRNVTVADLVHTAHTATVAF